MTRSPESGREKSPATILAEFECQMGRCRATSRLAEAATRWPHSKRRAAMRFWNRHTRLMNVAMSVPNPHEAAALLDAGAMLLEKEASDQRQFTPIELRWLLSNLVGRRRRLRNKIQVSVAEQKQLQRESKAFARQRQDRRARPWLRRLVDNARAWRK